ncbi:MAG: metallophosphoesterase family protein [Lachnospiraceae bacterium]|nr:metallophosphoesterase family protein [Lachnospiraceae bacterium]
MHRIAVLSDTHGLLRLEILEILRGCEAILHGGDINKQKILDELNRIAPVYVVRGNNDKEWAESLPETRAFTLYGLRFFMVHNKKQIPKEIDADIVIYGHSHKYEEKREEGKLFLNPGSCGPRRFTQPITMAVLEVEESAGENVSYRVEKIEIAQKEQGVSEKEDAAQRKLPKNIKQVIAAVMKDTDKGKSVREIAGRNGIGEELAEQICRLYLTHPGVDADGIMGKMGM